MTLVHVDLECPVYDSVRVRQVAGLFDLPLAARARSAWTVEVPDLAEAWNIGLIVGPSGSGKSTIAKAHFGALYDAEAWPSDAAVIDCFGELPIKQITAVLTAVGFGSPPSWVKPYHVLSNGERFRCNLARALLTASAAIAPAAAAHTLAADPRPLVVFDEFTSVVDRVVARVGSAAVAKALHSGSVSCRFVAVTCHTDVADWLEPDWVVDMATQTCQRRRLRRPPVQLELYRSSRSAWSLFARHHYLNGALSPTARCYVALWERRTVAFCATLPVIGRRDHVRITRLVTLPDFQGLGVGTRLAEAVGDLHRGRGDRFSITASHPAVIRHCRRSAAWRLVRLQKIGGRRAPPVDGYRDARGRSVVSFEYLGAVADASPGAPSSTAHDRGAIGRRAP